MYVFRKTENERIGRVRFEVGYFVIDTSYHFHEGHYLTKSQWVLQFSYETEEEAIKQVRYLNGGSLND